VNKQKIITVLYVNKQKIINVLYVNKQEFSASSWRSNQGYTKMHGQPAIKISLVSVKSCN